MTSTDSLLERFVTAQERCDAYARAIAELRSGQKTGHWMWFIFPQVAGLGESEMSKRYPIATLGEAIAYLDHPVLGPRLVECSHLVADARITNAEEMLGRIDAMKLRSSMTLFMRARPTEPVFADVLNRFFEGEPDPATDERVGLAH